MSMTHRERLIKTLKFQPVDRVPDYEFGAWEQTLTRWKSEGMPDTSLDEYFQLDNIKPAVNIGVNIFLSSFFESKVLEEKGDHITVQDPFGAVCEMMKPELGASIPRYIRYAVETREDWEKLCAEKLDPNTPSRYPKNLDEICKASWDSEEPVYINGGSLYGWLRNLMGVENLSIAIYEDPVWVEGMMEHLTRLALTVLEKIAGKAKVDVSTWWEDMCYRSGPLISPKHFKQWMVPRYKRVTDFLRNECGCEFNLVDCDGNIQALVPLWLEGGINVMFPLEVAHTDLYWISDNFGTKVALRGGFDKRALINGKEAIDKEFERIEPLFRRGGFIPHTDHLVPPDVSFENYLYYRKKKCEFIGKKD